MRESEILCHQCVYPRVLNYLATRCGPPANVRGGLAEHTMRCSHCGGAIAKGSGFVHVRGEVPVPSEEEVHRTFDAVGSAASSTRCAA
jgi:hypothetical protein